MLSPFFNDNFYNRKKRENKVTHLFDEKIES
jgi:hypothetical protein